MQFFHIQRANHIAGIAGLLLTLTLYRLKQ